jgi:sugar phosphate isomerase/epimerase
MNIKVALQLYTVREETAKDFKETIKNVAKIGYKGVEFAGYGGFSTEEMINILQENNISAVGSHVGFGALKDQFDETVGYMKKLGAEYITIPGLGGEMIKDYDTTVNTAYAMNELALKVKKAGLSLSYHNHSHEFLTKFNDISIEEIFIKYAPDLHFELDSGWSAAAGIDNRQFINKLGKRLDLVHIKDVNKDKTPVEIFTGTVDVKAVFEEADKLGVKWAIVEQDSMKAYPVFESIKVSYNNIIKNCK